MREKLINILSGELDFHGQNGNYASHNFHSFPAKFPPSLPRECILALTEIGDVVLDPMMGSGTTVLEAFINGRRGVGFDIDPLSILMSSVKTTIYNTNRLIDSYDDVIRRTRNKLETNNSKLLDE